MSWSAGLALGAWETVGGPILGVVGFVVDTGGSPGPLGVVAPPPPVSVVVGGPVPPADFASAAAFSSDMRMAVCLVVVTVLVVVSRVVMVVACGSVTGIEAPGMGTASLAAGVDVVAGSIRIGSRLISQSSQLLTTIPVSLQ